MRPIPRGIEASDFLFEYALPLVKFVPGTPVPALGSAAFRKIVVAHLVDLAALAIGATRDADAQIAKRGLKAVRLQKVKRDIIENLGSADLSVGAVAERRRLTVRCVERLFEEEGTTFSHYVLERRLVRVRGMLTSPLCKLRPISELAYANGFGDISNFNRAFRRHFGAAPSEVRNHGA